MYITVELHDNVFFFFSEISVNFQSNTIMDIGDLLELTIQTKTFSSLDDNKK